MAAGYKDFTAGAALAAADLEDYCELQAVMRFASSAARDTALSSVKTEGMLAYLIDTNTLTMYTGSAWSTIGPTHGALTTWTPAVVQSGSVTTTNNSSWYARVGRLVYGAFTVTCTGSGTGANVVTVSLPVTAAGLTSGFETIGTGSIEDASAGPIDYPGQIVLASSTTLKFYNIANATRGYLGASGFSAALAASDIICGQFCYQASADA